MPYVAKVSILMQCNIYYIYALNFTSNMNVVNTKQSKQLTAGSMTVGLRLVYCFMHILTFIFETRSQTVRVRSRVFREL